MLFRSHPRLHTGGNIEGPARHLVLDPPVRNDINHAGFNAPPSKPQDLERRAIRVAQDLAKPLLPRMEAQ